MKIMVLDNGTINQIAAGEVVERPSSIVKELMENAIDAGSTAITVEIKDGGTSLIRITDNGSGIEADDIPTAFLRHSTSKIVSAKDLLSISTLGFRGEALSSIAAVSQVELITKTRDAMTGTRYCIEGGKEVSNEQVGAPSGTTFLVRNLFYHTPARKKFLKSNTTEAGYISDIVQQIALSHPKISIRFIQNGQAKIHTPGNGNLKDAIYSIYGRDITNELLKIDAHTEDMHIEGYIGKPVLSRGNRTYENYYINGRFVKNKLIARAIEDAYKPYMMSHKYPFSVFQFELPQEQIDVNVHPSKMEIRFRNAESIYPFLYESISESLAHINMVPTVPVAKEEKKGPQKLEKSPEIFETRRIQESQNEKAAKPVQNPGSQPAADSIDIRKPSSFEPVTKREPFVTNPQPEQDSEKVSVPDKVPEKITKEHISLTSDYPQITEAKQGELDIVVKEEARPFLRYRIVGQVFATYWIVEDMSEQKMYMIDQHAAHEKILYEKFVKQIRSQSVDRQMISPPVVVSLSLQEENLFKEYKSYFEQAGFELTYFGGHDYAIQAIPSNLPSINKKELFLQMLDSLTTEHTGISETMILEKIASMSCKAAVKGNHILSEAEAKTLIDELMQLDNPYHCPHGRPVIIAMTKYEMDKKFKRIVD